LRLAKDEFGLIGVKFKGPDGPHPSRRNGDGPISVLSKKEAGKVKTTIVALFAAALIAAAPAVLAQNVSSKTPGQQHKTLKKRPHVAGYVRWHAARGAKMGHPSAFGYVPSDPTDYTLFNSRQAGGGGGGM
jgi:hypothetical protein